MNSYKLKSYKLLNIFVFLVFLISLVFYLGFSQSKSLKEEEKNKVDIGTTSFELFRQVLAYSYRDFVEDFDIKDKLNKTLNKMYSNLSYLGFNTNLYVINSGNTKQIVNDFEKYYDKMYSEVSNSDVDINKVLATKKLDDVQREIYKQFFETVKTKEGFLKFTIRSFCSTLDSYTEYMGPKEYKAFVESIQQGNFSGVGIVMFREKPEGGGEVVVVEVIDNSPAEKAGIKPGDKIVKVDDKDITSVSLDTVQSMIRGPENTNVKLTIKRNEKIMNFDIVRKIIHIKSVKLINNDDVPVIRIKTFGKDTSTEFIEAYEKAGKPSSFIIDLRNNGGGLLNEAVDILGYFVGKNKLGVKLVKRKDSQVFYTQEDKKIDATKVVLLVNNYTASASEIFAQGIKDYLKDNVIIVGQKTYGKNTVQTLYNLLDNGVLKLTIGKYYTISNRDVYKEKVTLDYQVDIDKFDQSKFYTNQDLQYKKALEIIKN